MRLGLAQILGRFKNPKNINKKYIFGFLVAILVAMLVVAFIRSVPKELKLGEYEAYLLKGQIKDAMLDNEKIIISTSNSRFYMLKDSIDLKELAKQVPISVKSDFNLDLLLSLGLIFGFFAFLIYNKKKNESQRTSAELSAMVEGGGITPTISNVLFKDVAGINEVKSELIEIVDFLKNPRKYKELGISLPRGVLMIGPPGVGKTLVAKAVAGEAGVPFFYQSGASFVQIYVGMGAKRVRELFAKAKSYAPSIIFIDEIDAVGKARGGGRNDEREATLNQLLTEMDGFIDSSGVIVIAATNKIEMIDEALLRSGRFDRRIYLALPDLNDRKDILATYLAKKRHEANIDELARHTTGFSGAGLATLVNEAAINAIKEKRKIIIDEDFKAVFSKVLHGKKKIYSLNQKEKKIQSLYKAAKALGAHWFGVEFERISLLEDRFIHLDKAIESKSEIIAAIKVCLVGKEAMKYYENELFSNANADIKEAKELARMLVSEYAMGEHLFGDVADMDAVLKACEAEAEEFVKSIKTPLFALRDYIYEHESVSKEFVKDFIKAQYE